MLALFSEYSADRQVIVATHSPYFIDLRAISSGAHLVRVVGDKKAGTIVYELTDPAIADLAPGNRNNPHVFGLDAKELFFQEDSVILTEGQEDVVM